MLLGDSAKKRPAPVDDVRWTVVAGYYYLEALGAGELDRALAGDVDEPGRAGEVRPEGHAAAAGVLHSLGADVLAV
eukprot:1618856-Pyramimonas_sp.AAC.1